MTDCLQSQHKVDGLVLDFWQVIEYLMDSGSDYLCCPTIDQELDHSDPEHQEQVIRMADRMTGWEHAVDVVLGEGLADIDEWLMMCSDLSFDTWCR
jgi:hypothetical protein